jgi:peroxiredoxin
MQPGQSAKNFTIEDIAGKTVSLTDYRDKHLMLSFYRYASCPLCNLRVQHLIKQYPSYSQKGLQMIAVFQSPQASIRKYVGKQDIPFPVIADPERILYQEYGVESSWIGFIKGSLRLSALTSAATKGYLPGKMEGQKSIIPADFLICPDLTIQVAYYGKDIGDHLPIQKIDEWLDNF